MLHIFAGHNEPDSMIARLEYQGLGENDLSTTLCPIFLHRQPIDQHASPICRVTLTTR
jgi:hypothetical protein